MGRIPSKYTFFENVHMYLNRWNNYLFELFYTYWNICKLDEESMGAIKYPRVNIKIL